MNKEVDYTAQNLANAQLKGLIENFGQIKTLKKIVKIRTGSFALLM